MGKDQELLEASRTGNFALVEKLIFPKSKSSSLAASLGIRVGAYINCQDQNGYTPLHHASLNGHSTITKFLLDAGASVNVADAKGSCPLHLAAWNGNAEIVRLLLVAGPNFASINEQNGDKETALHCAAQHGHTGAVKVLLDNHADPELRNIRDESALDLASQYGRLDVVRMLLSCHPKLLVHSPERFTPIHVASRNGHRGVVELLLAHGADINRVGANGTALHEAALFGKYDVVSLLLKRGAETNAKDSSGRTALELVSQLDTQISREIAKLIMARMQDGDDYEPLRSIVAATPVKSKKPTEEKRRPKDFETPTNVFASTSNLSRNLSRSFGEADLPSRDSLRGRPLTDASFRLSHLSPESSRSPARIKLKPGLLRRTSSARSARSLPRMNSSSSFHGNRSLHSFSVHRKKSDAMSLHDWSIRQHHPSIDMFPVQPTRASQSGRKLSVSEPSSPQLGASFVSSVRSKDSPEPIVHDPAKMDDDSVFFPGTPTSTRPSFETFLNNSNSPRVAPKAIIPLKPPADDSASCGVEKSSAISIFVNTPSFDETPNGSKSSALTDAQHPPPLPKKSSSSPPCGASEPSSPPIMTKSQPVASKRRSVNTERAKSIGNKFSGAALGYSSDEGIDTPKARSEAQDSSTTGASVSSLSDLKSPGAPKKPHRNKPPLNPPPLPPKPTHMVPKPRPPSPTNPPPDGDDDDDLIDETDSDDESNDNQTTSRNYQHSPDEMNEPTSPLYGNVSYEKYNPLNPEVGNTPKTVAKDTKIIEVEQNSGNHDDSRIADKQKASKQSQSKATEQTPDYASVNKPSHDPDKVKDKVAKPSVKLTKSAAIKVMQNSLPDDSTKETNDVKVKSYSTEVKDTKSHAETIDDLLENLERDLAKEKAETAPVDSVSVAVQSSEGSQKSQDSHSSVLQSLKSSAKTHSNNQSSSMQDLRGNTPHKEMPVATPSVTQSSKSDSIAHKSSTYENKRGEKCEIGTTASTVQSQKSTTTKSTVIKSEPSTNPLSAASSTVSQNSKAAPNSGGKSDEKIHSAVTSSVTQESKSNANLEKGDSMAMATSQVSRMATITQLKTRSETSSKPNEQMAPKLPEKRTKLSRKPNDGRSTSMVSKPQAAPRTTIRKANVKPLPMKVEPEPRKSEKHEPEKLEQNRTIDTQKTDGPNPASRVKSKNTDSIPPISVKSDNTQVLNSKEPVNDTSGDIASCAPEQIETEIANDKSANCDDPLSSMTRSPSPPFSPPSPQTAMLQVSTTLQKVIPSMQSSTDQPMHLSSRTDSFVTKIGKKTAKIDSNALKNQNLQKPELPRKKLSIRQQKVTTSEKNDFRRIVDFDKKSAKSLPHTKSSLRGILKEPKNVAGAHVVQKFIPNSTNFSTFPPRASENTAPVRKSSLKLPSSPQKDAKTRISSNFTAEKLSNKLRTAAELSSPDNLPKKSPATSRKPSKSDHSDGINVTETKVSPKPTRKTAHKDTPVTIRPRSSLQYTSAEVKRARICSTRSIAEMPTAPSYGEYDNLENLQNLSRSKRSSSLGPQVATTLPKKLAQPRSEVVRRFSDAYTQTYPPVLSQRKKSLSKSRSFDRTHPESKKDGTTPRVSHTPPQSMTSSPKLVPKIKPPLISTPPTTLQPRKSVKPKKPIKPAHLQSFRMGHNPTGFKKEAGGSVSSSRSSLKVHSPTNEDSASIITDKSGTSVRSLDTSEEWNDALSDRTDDLNLPKDVRRYRGLIRGSSLSYRSRFCGTRDAYESDEFEYDYNFDLKPTFSRVNPSLQQDEEDKKFTKPKKHSPKPRTGDFHDSRVPGDLHHFPLSGDFMEVESNQQSTAKISTKQNYGEPGEKRRKEESLTSLLNHTLETVISEEDQPSRNSSYDNNNNSNQVTQPVAKERSSSKVNQMTTAPNLPSPMSDGLPDFGTIVNTVTAVRSKASPNGSTSGVSSSSSSQSSTLAKQDPLAPYYENDEWAQIANVMKSVGSSLNKGSVYAQEFEETFWKIMTGSDLPRRVGTWLSDLGLPQYEEVLMGNGFDNVLFLASDILDEQDLIDMNIQNQSHRRRMLDSAKNLPKIKTLASYNSSNSSTDTRKAPTTVGEWLKLIALEEHEDMLSNMGFNTLEKASKMRDTEIAGIIPLLGHRKRIRASLGPMQGSKSRTTSQSSSRAGAKLKSSPPLTRSPLLDTVNFFKDYSQNVTGAKSSTATNSTLNTYGTASSSSSALTNYSSLSDQIVPVAILEEPESSEQQNSNGKYSIKQSVQSKNNQKERRRSKDHRSDSAKLQPYLNGSSDSHDNSDKKDNSELLTNVNQEEDLLTLAINKLTDASNNSSKHENKENIMNAAEPQEIRVPDARRASYLSTSGELVLRPPNETTEEGVNVSSWCHNPEVLIRSCCNYQAYYLGSMLVQEVKGVESTVEACAKMKKSTDSMKKIPTVTLSISYKGVKFIDSKSKHEIAEHEIHNISFASQDADDLSTLAYITRDARTDHHYCHVFRVMTLDVAYEIILTLGQAFEIAYQLILKEKALKEGSA